MENAFTLQDIQAAIVAVSFEYDVADLHEVEHYFNGFLVKWGGHTVLIAAKALRESAAACGKHGTLLASARQPSGERTEVEIDLKLPDVASASCATRNLIAFNVTEMLADHRDIVPMQLPWPPSLVSGRELRVLSLGTVCDTFADAHELSRPLQYDAGLPVIRRVDGADDKFAVVGIATGSGNVAALEEIDQLIEQAARASKLSI